jgi:hypothetical protein
LRFRLSDRKSVTRFAESICANGKMNAQRHVLCDESVSLEDVDQSIVEFGVDKRFAASCRLRDQCPENLASFHVNRVRVIRVGTPLPYPLTPHVIIHRS